MFLRGTIRALNRARKEKGNLWFLKKLPLLAHNALTMQKVKPEEWARRLKACYRCPMFLRVWSESAKTYEGERICDGCGCHMPTKALFLEMECWANANKVEELRGWRENNDG